MNKQSHNELTMEARQIGSAAVVEIRGSASIDQAGKMQQELEELAAKRIPVIVLDLSEMDFICSQGLGAIITAHLKSRHHKGQIRLVNPQPAVRELLETTRLTKLFSIYPSVDEATAT